MARQLDPEAQIERLERVLELTGLPDVNLNPSIQDVDLPRLLEILASDEAREFRLWLRPLDSLENSEIKHQISKLRDLVRRAVHSTRGKAARFAATTGMGLIPGGQLAALAAEALDSFVVENLVPEPGPTAFSAACTPQSSFARSRSPSDLSKPPSKPRVAI